MSVKHAAKTGARRFGDSARIVMVSFSFLLISWLQMRAFVPWLNGVLAQLQVMVSLYLTVSAPRHGFYAAMALNGLWSLMTAFAVYSQRDMTIAPGVAVPLCTMGTVWLLARNNRRIARNYAEIDRSRAEIEILYEDLAGKDRELERQNLQLIAQNQQLTEQQKQLHYQASFDPLTDLQNRVKFQERLAQAVQEAKRRNYCMALMMVDLDLFKAVNDSAGHLAGDVVLRTVGKRLLDGVRDKDLVYRVGGDEFTVLVEKVADRQAVRHIAERILAAMSEPFAVGDDAFRVGASIGVSLYPIDGEDAASLMKKADDAMYAVKRNGGNGWSFFRSQSMEQEGT